MLTDESVRVPTMQVQKSTCKATINVSDLAEWEKKGWAPVAVPKAQEAEPAAAAPVAVPKGKNK